MGKKEGYILWLIGISKLFIAINMDCIKSYFMIRAKTINWLI